MNGDGETEEKKKEIYDGKNNHDIAIENPEQGEVVHQGSSVDACF